jgi:hypothetical protein
MFQLKEHVRIVVVISVCALVIIALAGWSASGWSNQNPVVVTNGSEQPVPIYAPKQILVTLDNTPTEPGDVLPVNNPVDDPFAPPETGPAIGG